MRSRQEIQEYQRQYYLLCLQVDPEGMREQWRESKRRNKLKFTGEERSSDSPMRKKPLQPDSI
jgi:hypothetical protein